MKKITVVLSGVGAYGYSGIALMEFFYKHQIKPNLVVGSSGGSLVAALWAKGYDPQAAFEIVQEMHESIKQSSVDLSTSLFFFKNPLGPYHRDHALLKAGPIQALYHTLFHDQLIEHLPIQTIFITTNVDLGESHFLRNGRLSDAVYASSAILPFFPPVKINDLWLADGAFSEYLPLKVLLDENSDIIIAVDTQITSHNKPNNFMKYYAEFIQKALRISTRQRTSLVYDLHNDEILIIPIKIGAEETNGSNDDLLSLLQSARKSLEAKEASIFEALKL